MLPQRSPRNRRPRNRSGNKVVREVVDVARFPSTPPASTISPDRVNSRGKWHFPRRIVPFSSDLNPLSETKVIGSHPRQTWIVAAPGLHFLASQSEQKLLRLKVLSPSCWNSVKGKQSRRDSAGPVHPGLISTATSLFGRVSGAPSGFLADELCIHRARAWHCAKDPRAGRARVVVEGSRTVMARSDRQNRSWPQPR